LGRNTALRMGVPVCSPHEPALGGNSEAAIRSSRVLLWQGHCSVHQMFRPEHVHQFRQRIPGVRILVHPECTRKVVDLADAYGSTCKIVQVVEQAPPGSKWAIGTELHLVNRRKKSHPDQEIHFLSPVLRLGLLDAV
jgi:quinolinate synthase